MPKPVQDDLRERLLRLLAEPLADAELRERSEFDRRVGARESRLLLFGAGNIGRRALSVLRRFGREPLGFIDNNPALWNRRVADLEVFSPAEAARRFGPDDVAVVVTIWCGEATDRMADRIGPLQSLGFRHIALFGHLAWKYPESFLPHYSLDLASRALGQADRIVRAFDLFTERRSREIFMSHVQWRLHLDYDALPPPVNETIYFNERLIRKSDHEFLVDGGGYDGDSIRSFLASFGSKGFRRILSFEPDPSNFAKLEKYVASLSPDRRSRIVPVAGALDEAHGVINVEAAGQPSSRVGRGDHEVECRMIDDLADDQGAPSFIKLDVEGYELQALRGAGQTLRSARPVVTVCVYHLQNHLWEIPLALAEAAPEYRYTFVPHLADGWDLVLYAVPAGRVAAAPI